MTVKEILSHCENVVSMYVPLDSENLDYVCIFPDEFFKWYNIVPNNWQVSVDQFGDLYLTFDY